MLFMDLNDNGVKVNTVGYSLEGIVSELKSGALFGSDMLFSNVKDSGNGFVSRDYYIGGLCSSEEVKGYISNILSSCRDRAKGIVDSCDYDSYITFVGNSDFSTYTVNIFYGVDYSLSADVVIGSGEVTNVSSSDRVFFESIADDIRGVISYMLSRGSVGYIGLFPYGRGMLVSDSYEGEDLYIGSSEGVSNFYLDSASRDCYSVAMFI